MYNGVTYLYYMLLPVKLCDLIQWLLSGQDSPVMPIGNYGFFVMTKIASRQLKMPFNKQLNNLTCLISTGKYQTSVFFVLSRPV